MMTRPTSFLPLLTLICLCRHQGSPFLIVGATLESVSTLKPYTPSSLDSLILSEVDESILANGKSIIKELPGDGRAVMIQDVEASQRAVLYQVLNLPEYVGKVPKLLECQLYEASRDVDGTSTIKTRMLVNVFMGYKYQYFCDHTYHPHHGSLSWTLDTTKTSDLEGSVGLWKVQDHPTHEDWSRVYYACDIKLKVPAPSMVMTMLTKLNLKQALQWSKRESEAHRHLLLPEDFDPREFFQRGQGGATE